MSPDRALSIRALLTAVAIVLAGFFAGTAGLQALNPPPPPCNDHVCSQDCYWDEATSSTICSDECVFGGGQMFTCYWTGSGCDSDDCAPQ